MSQLIKEEKRNKDYRLLTSFSQLERTVINRKNNACTTNAAIIPNQSPCM